MTIQRSQRPSRPTGRGRPKKPAVPPPATGRPNVDLELFSPSDLQNVASEVGLSVVSAELLASAVTTINDGFSNFANATAIQTDNSPASQRRDWCGGIVKGAADLQLALGHTQESPYFEKSAFNAAEILAKGWPVDPQLPQDQALRQQLVSALSFALPERYALGAAARSDRETDEDVLVLLGRLGPSLHVVSLLARTAQAAWGSETNQHRNGQDRGRRYLMARLVPAYTDLFGHPPTAAPGSAGFKWTLAVIMRAGLIAGEQRSLPGQDELPTEQARVAALEAIVALAARVAPPGYKMKTGGTAKVDHWIRAALKSVNAEPRR